MAFSVYFYRATTASVIKILGEFSVLSKKLFCSLWVCCLVFYSIVFANFINAAILLAKPVLCRFSVDVDMKYWWVEWMPFSGWNFPYWPTGGVTRIVTGNP